MATDGKTDVGEVGDVVRSVVLDVLRRRAAGESLPDEQVIASRPDLADQLRLELTNLQQICAAGNDAERQSDVMLASTETWALRTPGMLQLQCPHCREPFEAETDTPVTEIVCSTCGGQFSLAGDDRETRSAPSLKSLAHFDLIERLGVGGFGTVWKARDRKLDRTVAVKIPRQGMLNNEELEKFLREARAAAQLQHPSIVRVHEVGRDGDSVFIVSDFVRGAPLDEWLTGQQPTMRQAAEICMHIAEALQHAHDRGVIHRDLKPANILIDGGGRPHLMDFGLARRVVGEVTLTLDGQVLGTPAYMSPEQAQGEAHTADARSDVYSLGVILFQLLTGELPFRGGARMLMHQVIHDPPPSPRKFSANVRKDLETITLKCLEKEPTRRYQTARQLADEFGRYLAGQPILARPVGRLERGWRWCQRNRTVASLGAALFSTLIAIALVSPIVAWRQAALRTQAETARAGEAGLRLKAEAAEKKATTQARKSEQVAKFLSEMLKTVGPSVALGRNPTMLMLSETEDRFVDLKDQPEVEADLRIIIGDIVLDLGDYQKAEAMQSEALAIRRRLFGNESLEAAESLSHLAFVFYMQGLQDGRLSKAEATFRESLAIRKKLLGSDHADVADSLRGLALVLHDQQRSSEAEPLHREAIAIVTELYGRNSPKAALYATELAGGFRRAGKLDEAEAAYREVLPVLKQQLGDLHPEVAIGLWEFGSVLEEKGNLADAEAMFRESLELRRKVYGDEHPLFAQLVAHIAQVLERQGKLADAEVFLRQTLAAYRKQLGDEHPEVRKWVRALTSVYERQGKNSEAESLQREFLSTPDGLIGGAQDDAP